MDLHLRCRDADMVAYEPGIEWAHVWEWYATLTYTRQVGMAANPITFFEVEAYCRLMRLVMEPWEVSAIIAIDSQVREHSAKKPAGGPKTESMSDGAAIKDVTSRVGKKRTIVVPQGELRKASG